MKNIKLLKKSIVYILCALLMILSLVTASAQSTTEISLSDTQSGISGTYELLLSAKCDSGISAFEILLEYDTEQIVYYGATVCVDNLNHSINALDSGKVQIVGIADGVISCEESTPVATIKLKSLTEADARVGVAISGVIDGKGEVLSEDVFNISTVKVSSSTDNGDSDSASQQTDSVFTEKVSLEDGEMSLVKGYTSVAGIPVKNQTLVSIVLATICTLFMVVYVAFKVGANMQKKKYLPIPLEFEEDTEDK